jgi:hypothetical protein
MKDPSARADTRRDPEGDDWADQQARQAVLKIVVIVLGVILAVLALVVLSTLAVRVVKGGPPPAPALPAGSPPTLVALPPGARVLGSSIGDGRILVNYELEGRGRVLVLDAATLQPLAEIGPPPH